jgi:hypothetical protein
MSSTIQIFFLDDSFGEREHKEEIIDKDVENIVELFRLLSPENKVKVKQLLKSEKIF